MSRATTSNRDGTPDHDGIPNPGGAPAATGSGEWHQTACMLCSINCGVEIKISDRRITRVRGDKAHPGSRGYTCEKALRLDHYQNGKDRLNAPLRRRADGTYEEIDWDTAIGEVAAGLARVRDEHGGEKIFYYGGGAQGNHLPGGYSGATRKALGMRYQSNALAQEKTGEFWVDGQLYGAMACHTAPDFHHTDCAVFVGKNPWHSHGFPRARVTLKEISNDPDRHLIVIDPRRTETAELADIHIQLRPGGDAWLLGAMLKILLSEGLADQNWLARHANGLDELTEMLSIVDVEQWCEKAGVTSAEVRHATTVIANARSCAILEDLGIQMAPHSTLNSWLEKLIYILTANFGNKGGMNLHSRMGKLAGGGSKGRSPVGGHRILGGLIACNNIPGEILTDHPDRFRAMIVESSNPIHSLADSQRMREAFRALDLVVVIDVAMTETAREADYVLPACSQYEKWEATFFTTEFPDNYFHLRRPIFEALEGTLTEAEIHRRLCRALGAYNDEDLAPLTAAAEQGLEAYGEAFFATLAENPELGKYTPIVLYETLGPALGEGNEVAAVMWGLSQIFVTQDPEAARRAGIEGEGLAQGDALFEKIFTSPSGMVFSTDPYEQTWERMRTPDHRINLMIDELREEFDSLATTDPRDRSDEYPFVLSAGERRSYTANTAIRDPEWRRKKPGTGLRINPDDAESLGLSDGAKVRLTTKRGETVTEIEISSTLQPGHVSLPNGTGLTYPDVADDTEVGISPNELTSEEDRDWFAGTPWHKHVRARLEKV